MAKKYNSKWKGRPNKDVKHYAKQDKVKTAGVINDIEVEREIKFQINRFIKRHQSGEGNQRLAGINEFLKTYPHMREELIHEIHNYILEKYPDADGVSVYCKADKIDELIKEISVKDFNSKKYEFYPFLLKKGDFYKMTACPKNRILVDGFSKTGKSFRFLNNYVSPVVDKEERFTNDYRETKFYASADRKMIFGKKVRQTFRVSDVEGYLQEFGEGKDAEYDENISHRGSSVAMFCFLQGKEEHPELFARLDDDGYDHKNLLIDDDKRRVFGERAGFPHFHFQNYTDQYLCRKDTERGFETGRCNAIDIPHLLNYLKYLESLSPKHLYSLYHKHENCDLPFLDIMIERPVFPIKPMKTLKEFMAELSRSEREMCVKFFESFDKRYNKSKALEGLKYYKEFGFTLLLLQFVSDKYWSEKDLTYKKFLGGLEITLSEKIMDTICNVGTKLCMDKHGNPLKIANDYGEEYTTYPSI